MGFRVADDGDLVVLRLLSLADTNLDINGVAVNADLHRTGTEEQVTVVHVQGGQVVAVLFHCQVFVEQRLVVDVALVDAEELSEQRGRIDRVADEFNVAEIVLPSLVDIDVDVHFVGFHVESVVRDDGVAVTKLVIAVDEVHLVLLVIGFDELRGFEDTEFHAVGEIVVQMILDILGLVIARVLEEIGDGGVGLVKRHEAESLLGLFHGTEQHGIRDAVVAVDGDFFNLDLLGLMDVEQEVDRVFHLLVGDLLHIDLTAVEAFVDVVSPNDVLAGDLHVVIDNVALRYTHLLAKVVFLVLGGSLETESNKAGAFLKADVQKDKVALHAGGGDFHIFVEPRAPKALYSLGNFLARNLDNVTHMEREQPLVERGRSGGGDAADFVRFRRGVVNLHRLGWGISAHNNLGSTHHQAEAKHQ